MKKTWITLLIAALVGVGQMIYRGITTPEMLTYLIVFFLVGWGLALLRVFVNGSIKKMKGKSIGVKILFFAVLLGLGLPFQSWFRKEIIMSMDSMFIFPCIISLAAGVVFFTMVYNLFIAKFFKKNK